MLVGWVVHRTLDGGPTRFRTVPPPVSMRVVNTARWINRHSERIRCEMYRRDRRYDVVVFFKTMDERSREEARRIQAYGGKVVFDANVNYYEIWGDFPVEDTRPTLEQQAEAIAMTRLADWVVADSTYILDVVRPINERASWVPDNVDMRRFRRYRRHTDAAPVRLVWSGVAKKAVSLLEIRDVLSALDGFELVVVSDTLPPVLRELQDAVPCEYVRWSERRYARLLRRMDVIISPRALTNSYDLGHSEYKITLGMAAGLPAIASPQPAYVEAIGDSGGGIVAADADEWLEALQTVRDRRVRAAMGARARKVVVDRYSTPVVARRYEELLWSLG